MIDIFVTEELMSSFVNYIYIYKPAFQVYVVKDNSPSDHPEYISKECFLNTKWYQKLLVYFKYVDGTICP